MSRRPLAAAFTLCLFTLIVAAKWATFDRFGSPMPDWDQWDAEASELLIPWQEGGGRFLTHLFHPHNEHRVVLTKLQNLALTLANGQWDARLQAASNAVLHAFVAAACWILAVRRWRGTELAGLWLVVAALFGLPVAWQNVLGGFHSQQYWLLGLSLATLALLPFAPAWSARWWTGAAAAALALGSMGSGLLAGAAAGLLAAWRGWRREAPARDVAPTLAVAALVVAAGLLLRVEVDWHQPLKARSVADFLLSLSHSLQWPWREQPAAALLLWLPWALVAARVVARPRPAAAPPAGGRDAAQLVTALGGWVLLQVAATAYARGAGGDYPASRYMDTLVLGAVANALALLHLRQDHPARIARAAAGALALAWLAVLGGGLRPLLEGVFRVELPDARGYYTRAEGHLRRYLATGNPAQLVLPDVPYPSVQGLVDRLEVPGIRDLLPVPVRVPATLAEDPAAGGGFLANDARGWTTPDAPRRGLSPGTPALDHGVTWGSHGPAGAADRGVWRSAPLPPPARAWLRLETAGHAGEPGVHLELRAAGGGELLATVAPARVPGESWRTALVRSPRVPFVITARDEDPARWLAFSGPVEMGGLSYAAWQATKHGRTLLIAVLAVTAALAGATLVRRRPGTG